MQADLTGPDERFDIDPGSLVDGWWAADPLPLTLRPLAAGQSVTVTVYADSATGSPVPGGTVYLSFSQASGGGSASVGGTALSSSPAAFTASNDGTIAVTYTAPATLPSTGTDTLTAANAASGATATATDSYSFAATPSSGGNTVLGTGEALMITVMTSTGQTVSYPLAPDVTVTQNGQPSTLASYSVGDTVSLTLNSQDEVTAIDITSNPSGSTSGSSGS